MVSQTRQRQTRSTHIVRRFLTRWLLILWPLLAFYPTPPYLSGSAVARFARMVAVHLVRQRGEKPKTGCIRVLIKIFQKSYIILMTSLSLLYHTLYPQSGNIRFPL